MLISILGHFCAVCVGISLGLIGGGGSILAVPILAYVLGVPLKSAIVMSLVIVGIVSLIGIIPHWQQGNVNMKTAALFAPGAMVGAYIGARIATLPIITPTFQLILFVSTMFLAAYLMIKNASNKSETELNLSSKYVDKFPLWPIILAEGLGVGLLSGLVGIGGGFMIIPALVLMGNTPIKEAVGTSLVIIALKSVTGFAGYLGSVSVDINLMVTFTLAAGTGMLIGAYLTNLIQGQNLEKYFGYFVILVAIFMLFEWGLENIFQQWTIDNYLSL
ncbi:sulfite exporter TauE/SafE family protein [Sphaerospermopsis aphanizomenoides BCCUSP55]|uniref:sulfite exporter TauE/SafE family protein n=1 Tax=Sphaerospermopsis aphanizomenoides TaxID=459663 RepID=UPI0019087C26|nr:sulfite exporter TauE/SafE family protein [Sphaerospermopsis aphanizomenoides]MBK1990308.1 sulfite exporter TauE/SafE family protein [Sphaerospermopsis aphanizomenoides BCCUSP55]